MDGNICFLYGVRLKKGCIRGTICLQMHPDPISDVVVGSCQDEVIPLESDQIVYNQRIADLKNSDH
jgi:hypothetical protein